MAGLGDSKGFRTSIPLEEVDAEVTKRQPPAPGSYRSLPASSPRLTNTGGPQGVDIKWGDTYRDPNPSTDAPKLEADTGLGADYWKALKQGTRDVATRMVTALYLAGLVDEDTAARSVSDAEQKRIDKPDYVKPITQAAAEISKAWNDQDGITGITDTLMALTRGVGTAAVTPRGLGYLIVENMPSMLPVMGGATAGSVVGGTVGRGPGAMVGAVGGMLAGNTALEAGAKVPDILAQLGVDVRNPEAVRAALPGIRDQAAREGLTKGSVITAIDTLSAGLLGRFLTAPGRAAEREIAEVLARKGIDPTNMELAAAALRRPDIRAEIEPVLHRYAERAGVVPGAGRIATAIGTEGVTEGAGEFLGELAATGKADLGEAFIEGIAGMGQGMAEVGLSTALQRTPTPLTQRASAGPGPAPSAPAASGGPAEGPTGPSTEQPIAPPGGAPSPDQPVLRPSTEQPAPQPSTATQTAAPIPVGAGQGEAAAPAPVDVQKTVVPVQESAPSPAAVAAQQAAAMTKGETPIQAPTGPDIGVVTPEDALDKPATEKQVKARQALKTKADAKKRVNPDTDTLTDAIIKLGGIKNTERLDIAGDDKAQKYIPFVGALFRREGGDTLDGLGRRLMEYGYLSPEEADDNRLLSDRIREELAGTKQHYSLQRGNEAMGDQRDRELAARHPDAVEPLADADIPEGAYVDEEQLAGQVQQSAEAEGVDLSFEVSPADLAAEGLAPTDAQAAVLADLISQLDETTIERLSMEYADRPDSEFLEAVKSALSESTSADQQENEGDHPGREKGEGTAATVAGPPASAAAEEVKPTKLEQFEQAARRASEAPLLQQQTEGDLKEKETREKDTAGDGRAVADRERDSFQLTGQTNEPSERQAAAAQTSLFGAAELADQPSRQKAPAPAPSVGGGLFAGELQALKDKAKDAEKVTFEEAEAAVAEPTQAEIQTAVNRILTLTQGSEKTILAAIGGGLSDTDLVKVASKAGWGGSMGGATFPGGAVEGRGTVVTVDIRGHKKKISGGYLATLIRNAAAQWASEKSAPEGGATDVDDTEKDDAPESAEAAEYRQATDAAKRNAVWSKFVGRADDQLPAMREKYTTQKAQPTDQQVNAQREGAKEESNARLLSIISRAEQDVARYDEELTEVLKFGIESDRGRAEYLMNNYETGAPALADLVEGNFEQLTHALARLKGAKLELESRKGDKDRGAKWLQDAIAKAEKVVGVVDVASVPEGDRRYFWDWHLRDREEAAAAIENLAEQHAREPLGTAKSKKATKKEMAEHQAHVAAELRAAVAAGKDALAGKLPTAQTEDRTPSGYFQKTWEEAGIPLEFDIEVRGVTYHVDYTPNDPVYGRQSFDTLGYYMGGSFGIHSDKKPGPHSETGYRSFILSGREPQEIIKEGLPTVAKRVLEAHLDELAKVPAAKVRGPKKPKKPEPPKGGKKKPAPPAPKKSAVGTELAAMKDKSAEAQAKADLNDALADLGDILGKNARLNITPEQEVKLLPVLTRVFDAAFRLGYHKFKAAAQFVLKTIRDKFGAEAADAITIEHLQGAYIGMSHRYRDQGAEAAMAVASVPNLLAVHASEEEAAPSDLRAGDVVMVVGGKYQGTIRTLLKVPTKPFEGYDVSDRLGPINVAQVKFHRRPADEAALLPVAEKVGKDVADLKTVIGQRVWQTRAIDVMARAGFKARRFAFTQGNGMGQSVTDDSIVVYPENMKGVHPHITLNGGHALALVWQGDDAPTGHGKRVAFEKTDAGKRFDQAWQEIKRITPIPGGQDPLEVKVFASGLSRSKDFGKALASQTHTGVEIGELSDKGMEDLAAAMVGSGAEVFVDSGAFSIFRANMRAKQGGQFSLEEFGEGGKALDFDEIFKRYDRLALLASQKSEDDGGEAASRLWFVMPDIVGDQAGSLELVRKYADRILTATYGNAIVPLQTGKLSLLQAFDEIQKIVGKDARGAPAMFTVGIPSAKVAAPMDQVVELLRERGDRMKGVHFLGAASESRMQERVNAVREAGFEGEVSGDANMLRSKLYGDTDRAAALRKVVGEAPAGDVLLPAKVRGELNAIKTPADTYIFVGAVPDDVYYVDGATKEQILAGKQFGARFGPKQRVFKTGREIVEFAASKGYKVLQAEELLGGGKLVDQGAHDAATSPTNKKPLPTAAQIAAGNYEKGHVTLNGVRISIENPVGSIRTNVTSDKLKELLAKPMPKAVREYVGMAEFNFDDGTDPVKVRVALNQLDKAKAIAKGDAKELLAGFWHTTMKAHYGYFIGVQGKDGDNLDVFIRPGTPLDYIGPVHVIDQNKPDTGRFDEHKVMIGWVEPDHARADYLANFNPEAEQEENIRGLTSLTWDEFRAWLESKETIKPVSDNPPPKLEELAVLPAPDGGRTIAPQAPNAPSPSVNLERDRPDAKPADRVGPVDLFAKSGEIDPGGPAAVRSPAQGGSRPQGGDGVSAGGTAPAGERGDQPVRAGQERTGTEGSAAGSAHLGRGDLFGDEGARAGGPAAAAASPAARSPDVASRLAAQRKANTLPVVVGDRVNVDETLPFLHTGQRDDVHFAETRFAKPRGFGVLFTNGTGTGKTYSGLGEIARHYRANPRRGGQDQLIVVPNDKIAEDWMISGRNLGLEISQLPSTDTAGDGIVVTTYANFGQNDAIIRRNWTRITLDEAHYLSSSKEGTVTHALRALRAITRHPDGFFRWFDGMERQLVDELAAARSHLAAARAGNDAPMDMVARLESAADALQKRYNAKLEERRALYDAGTKDAPNRARATFLSATPFAYVESIDWAEGYLFEYDPDGTHKQSGAYNSTDAREAFYVRHFGFRMRYGKLTKPDADVDNEIMERQFNGWLKNEGAVSARMLDVEADYDRRFVLVSDAIGTKIDEGFQWLSDTDDHKFRALGEWAKKNLFDYHHQMYLLESLKARHAVEHIKQHLALGRKVVVFHDFNKGGGFHPFRFPAMSAETTVHSNKHGTMKWNDLVNEFEARRKDLIEMDFDGLRSPLQTMKAEFPKALFFNGLESTKDRREAIKKFNTDKSGDDLIVVQADAGREGISLHDTTGEHQRVVLNLGMPVKPIQAVQIEGRIYRTGQVTDAAFRYFNTGTNFERWTFANKIAERASTAENLAMGDDARALKESIVEAFSEAEDFQPSKGEGKGGKQRDRANARAVTAWMKAKTFYFGQQKKTKQRRDQREGQDYFATPEPLGLKMVEWAQIRMGESVLEPSAGHGAIARFFPELNAATAIEPSFELSSRAALVVTKKTKVITGTFEDHHIVNKYGAVVMNPPFGHGGATAIRHLDQAAGHLENGGRIVALIPTGPAADKAFEKWLYDDEAKKMGMNHANGVYMTAEIRLPRATFERAGTEVAARIVILDKQYMEADKARLPGGVTRDLSDALTIAELFDRIEQMDMPGRITPTEQPKPASAATLLAGRGAVLPSTGAPVSKAPAQQGIFALRQLAHTKTGEALFYASPQIHVSREEYSAINSLAKTHNGYWSSFRGGGAPKGFIFRSDADRAAFLLATSERGSPKLSRRGDAGKGMSVTALRAAVDPVVGHWINAPKVRIVADVSELPFAAVAGNAEGVYHGGGVVWLVADNISGRNRALEVLSHEVVGHYAMERVYGKEWEGVVAGVKRLEAIGSKPVVAAARVVDRKDPGLDADRRTAEIIAVMAEQGVQHSLLQRLIGAAQSFLRRLGFFQEITTADLAAMLRNAEKWVRAGLPLDAELAAEMAYSRKAPKFYSTLREKLAGLKRDKGTPQEWKAIIGSLKQQGVKEEEIKWSGIMEFLDTVGRSTDLFPFFKTTLLTFLDENGVKVNETVRGDDQEQRREATEWAPERRAAIGRLEDEYRAWGLANGFQPQEGPGIRSLLSADEMLRVYDDLTPAQREYVGGFISRWDQVQGGSMLDLLKVELDALGYDLIDDAINDVFGVERRSDRLFFTDSVPDTAAEDGMERHYHPLSELPDAVRSKVERIGRILESLQDTHAQVPDGMTRFSTWKFPYGTQYRELLLTLPDTIDNPSEIIGKPREVADLTAEGVNFTEKGTPGYVYEMGDGTRIYIIKDVKPTGTVYVVETPDRTSEHKNFADAEQALSSWARSEFGPMFPMEKRAKYLAGHWTEPNVVAHVRFDDRRSADGKKVLFIEEFQSDWAHDAREEGIAGPERVQAVKAARERIQQLDKETNELLDQYDGRSPTATSLSRVVASMTPTDHVRYLQLRSDRLTAHNLLTAGPGVAAAPFIGKTESWVGLALKRVLIWAAEGGYDAIAWTTGQQQINRYKLEHHIESLDIRRSPNAAGDMDFYWSLAIHTKKGEVRTAQARTARELTSHIGKELAGKVLQDRDPDRSEWQFKGLDLQVGGEGMRQFYDKILPNVVNDVVPKLGGARVATIEFTPQSEETPNWTRVETHTSPDQVGKQPGILITPELRARALGGLPLFSRREPPAPPTGPAVDMNMGMGHRTLRAAAAAASRATGRESLATTLFRVPTQLLGVDKATRALYGLIQRVGGFIVPEGVKEGVVDNYGLPEAVVDRRSALWGHIRSGYRTAEEVLAAFGNLTRGESAYLYELANNKDPADVERLHAALPRESVQVLAYVQNIIHQLSNEAIRLGQITADTVERNRFAYLHRSYRKWDIDQTPQERATRARAVTVLGEQYRGRGLTEAVRMDAIRQAAPEWWGRRIRAGMADKALVKQKFLRFERRANRGEGVASLPGMEAADQPGRLLEVTYWPAELPVPARLNGWTRAGEWEVRDVQGDKAIMWRDFTKEERVRMGEIDEIRYAVAKTLHHMIHDVEVGRYLEWLANQYGRTEETLPRGAKVVEAKENLFRTFARDEWVHVPEATAAGTKTPKYGKLAGSYIPGPIWNDVRQVVNYRHQPFGRFYASLLRSWKISKTAMSPVTHFNNVAANIIMADWHDVLAQDLIQALAVLVEPTTEANRRLLATFEDAGGSSGMYALTEIQREQLAPMIKSLRAELDQGEANGMMGVAAALALVREGEWRQAYAALQGSKVAAISKAVVDAAMKVYEKEDTVFRLAAFIKAKHEGASDLEAGKVARRSFLDYEINAPWIQLARHTIFPFIAFAYRAVPMLLHVATHKPWKMAKLWTFFAGLNALGYLFSGGDEDDERRRLPEQQTGRVLGIVPRLIRMPWNDPHGAPVFLDVRRWIPVGDIVDATEHSAIPWAQQLTPGGPLALLAELMFNRSLFTGKSITKETDNASEMALKVANHLYAGMMPNLPIGIPGVLETSSLRQISSAAKGRTDILGREQSTLPMAAASSVGLKFQAYPADIAGYNARVEYTKEREEIRANIRAAARELVRKGITQEEYDARVARETEKLVAIAKKLEKRAGDKPAAK